jgi:hypothetical protein
MQDMEQHWRKLSEEVISGMKEWRDQHPNATLREIEAAIDERLNRMRARMLEDAALAIPKAGWSEAQDDCLEKQLHQLKQAGPAAVLAKLRRLRDLHPQQGEIGKKLAYLHKREKRMHYPAYQALGWPIGSGMVESGNKVVMQARLKGAGRQRRSAFSFFWPELQY